MRENFPGSDTPGFMQGPARSTMARYVKSAAAVALSTVSNAVYVNKELNYFVISDVISEQQSREIIDEIDIHKLSHLRTDPLLRFRHRKYERNHWDNAIQAYKEVQRPIEHWGQRNKDTLVYLQELIQQQCNRIDIGYEFAFGNKIEWLAPHIIDLASDGVIYPHVDSVKHSGEVICGLSLLSEREMILSKSSSDNDNKNKDAASTEIVDYIPLKERSLYVLAGKSRYELAHSIPQAKQGVQNRRLSIILRDIKV